MEVFKEGGEHIVLAFYLPYHLRRERNIIAPYKHLILRIFAIIEYIDVHFDN